LINYAGSHAVNIAMHEDPAATLNSNNEVEKIVSSINRDMI